MRTQPGTRVFAVLEANADRVRAFGWGTYTGDVVPDSPCQGVFSPAPDPDASSDPADSSRGIQNPRILLDTGEVVWGAECWWGPEGSLKVLAMAEGPRPVTLVSRKEAFGEEAEKKEELRCARVIEKWGPNFYEERTRELDRELADLTELFRSDRTKKEAT